MNIGIDARLLSEKITGINRFLWNVVKFLPQFDHHNKYSLFTYSETGFNNNFYSYSYIKRSNLPRQLAEHSWLNLKLPNLIKDLKIDLFFTPYILVPFKKGKNKNVIVIHDVMTKSCPQFFTNYYKKYMDVIVPQAIKRSDAIVTVSESARRGIIDFYNVNPKKVHCMHLWTDDKYKPFVLGEEQKKILVKKYSLPNKYILYVGAIEERKNIRGILEISDILKSKAVDIKFVFVGNKGYGFNNLIEEINKRKDRVLYINYVDENDLASIYNLAEIFLFPSYYEGFGLPPLEAMKTGLPVLVAKNSSLIEVVGEGGLMINDYDLDSFAENIILLLKDKEFHSIMKTKALKQAEKFNSENEIPKLIKIFNSLDKNIRF